MKSHSIVTWLIVWLATLLVSLFSLTFLFSLGLILIEYLVFPLALGIGALLAGLTAAGFSNLLVRDDLYTPVEVVVKRCEGMALALVLILIAAAVFGVLRGPFIVTVVLVAIILSVVATFSALKIRLPGKPDGRRWRKVILWLLIAAAAIPVVIYLASLFGWAGA